MEKYRVEEAIPVPLSRSLRGGRNRENKTKSKFLIKRKSPKISPSSFSQRIQNYNAGNAKVHFFPQQGEEETIWKNLGLLNILPVSSIYLPSSPKRCKIVVSVFISIPVSEKSE